MKILHLSDLHPKTQIALESVSDQIVAALDARGPIEFITVTGDLALMGSKTDLAAYFLERLANALGVAKRRIICCPGNHDLQLSDKGFGPFLKAMESLYGSLSEFTIPLRTSVHIRDDVGFLCLNSAYHGDHTFGQVDLDHAANRIDEISSLGTRIALVHHHLLPTQHEDSHIRNAYELASFLTTHNIQLLIHGHRHANMRTRLGSMRVIGAGTAIFPPHPDVGRQFNLIDIGRQVVRFRYQADAINPRGLFGKWEPLEESW